MRHRSIVDRSRLMKVTEGPSVMSACTRSHDYEPDAERIAVADCRRW